MVRARLLFGREELALRGGETIVGRDDTCAIVINDDSLVSRAHAAFFVEGNDVVLRDLGSRNGTRVNGLRLDAPRRLADGDRIRIGARELAFFDSDARPPRKRDGYETGKRWACAHCGEEIPAEVPACPHCGRPVS